MTILFENPGDRRVSMDELQAIWADLKERGVLYNGMTHAALCDRYGDRVYHVRGTGWFVRPEEKEMKIVDVLVKVRVQDNVKPETARLLVDTTLNSTRNPGVNSFPYAFTTELAAGQEQLTDQQVSEKIFGDGIRE